MRSRWLGCLLVLAVGCGGSDEETANSGLGVPGAGGVTGGTVGGYVDSGAPIVTTLGGTVGGMAGGVGGPGAVVGGTTGGGASGGTAIPCDVQKILKDKCQVCHSNPPVGAPVPLVSLADFQAASLVKTTEKMFQRVHARINETGATSMPPPARPQLTAQEKAALDAWVSGGSKGAAATACGGTVGGTPGAAGGGMTGATGGGMTGATGGGMGGVVNWDTDCDYKMELLAHGGQTANDTTPYNATKSGDSYEIFWFAPTWNEKVHAIDIQPVIDNGAVLHHWLLYMKQSGSEAPGSHNSDSGLQSSDSALLSGWAPGNKSFTFPPDVGMQVIQGSGARFGIEIHYNTSANPPKRQDRSGAKICLSKKLRQKEAATHWLGTQAIIGSGKFDAVGTCSVTKESHIIAMSPHMHKTGVYQKSIVMKKAGGTATITDKPFAFDDQQIFPIDSPTGEIVVQPGDTITTTCSYNAPGFITFGPGTADEMCYNFVIAWPAGSLSNGSPGLVGGKNTCIDGI